MKGIGFIRCFWHKKKRFKNPQIYYEKDFCSFFFLRPFKPFGKKPPSSPNYFMDLNANKWKWQYECDKLLKIDFTLSHQNTVEIFILRWYTDPGIRLYSVLHNLIHARISVK